MPRAVRFYNHQFAWRCCHAAALLIAASPRHFHYHPQTPKDFGLSAPHCPDLSVIAADMQAVDRLIHAQLHTGVPLVAEVSQYTISAGGKRLRPALLLLMAGALGYSGEQHHQLAVVLEFIHTATLLHDDVVDDSTLRRSRPTANTCFGNPASVLVGDFLYSRAFQLMVECKNMRVMQVLAEATNIISEGEVLQLMHMGDASLTQDDYLRVIQSKTAKLFEASSRLAAVLTNSPLALEEQCATYGQALGTAFQIIDDVLDYEGTVALLGKNLGNDLREGKATLPLILAMRQGSPEQAATVRQALDQGADDAFEAVAQIVRDTGALAAARQAAAEQANRAVAAIAALPNNVYVRTLRALAMQLQHRTV